ncbi:acyl-CoA N-acyltransferase [Thozetella sp. PMI_491]|nr:acyl-CoA N-acyltransferase [Thozetella sp. PMI_491]
MENPEITITVKFPLDDAALNGLHSRAFGQPTSRQWSQQLSQHALSWAGAIYSDNMSKSKLVGFIHMAWDGGLHAFLLDTCVDPDFQHKKIGSQLVQAMVDEARKAGCTWLHVDYEARLKSFYESACGFRKTEAGLLHLEEEG